MSTAKVEEGRLAYEKMADFLSIAVHHDSITGTASWNTTQLLYGRLKNATEHGYKLHPKLLARSLDVGELDANLAPNQWISVRNNFNMDKESYIMV